MGRRRIWSAEMHDYLAEVAPGRRTKEIVKLFNERFGTNKTPADIRSQMSQEGIRSGLPVGGFPGMGKGRDGIETTPVGHEWTDTRGNVWIKVAKPNPFPKSLQRKSHFIWEQAHGPVPEGHVLTFLNGDRSDVRLDNLACVSRSVSMRITQHELRFEVEEFTSAGVLVGTLMEAADNALKKEETSEREERDR